MVIVILSNPSVRFCKRFKLVISFLRESIHLAKRSAFLVGTNTCHSGG